mmetsp:Transcript_17463/g.25808  ORF Transcript_17463/g.25808 Transcript_17463/m.25808 type:complete len:437 (-) Transcript_17463:197-1507(-)|eukprot:CAMPEP_0194211840 /NCGR_PEP_ID=MMETSP0156-20130528/11268_1 /TAXON_ID=33649 /ORGANISM="Thalassionema nitzschioides, Strain L26-B" /LENGTH=436 /DNA_ID=CAMNT_0038939521 /DNA_START=124 /DNA_END=1434 /DNA_ORIENTATION=+
MVLTDRQRGDLHAGIYEYLLSREGEAFQQAAAAFAAADPEAAKKKGNNNNSSSTTLLEKKWTAIPRLQKKVLELERAAAHNTKIHAHRAGGENGSIRRLLPRLPASQTLQGHSAVVLSVQVHPVFTVVVTGSEDGSIKVWDHESGDYVKTLKGHTNSVTDLDFSPTGTVLASCSTDLSVKLWDFSTYSCIRTLRGHDHTISAIRFLPSSSILTMDKSNGNGNKNAAVDVEAMASQFLLSASRDTTVKVWDVVTGFCEDTIKDHGDWVRCLAVREDMFCSAGNDTVIHLYDSSNRKKICDLRGHEHVVETLSFLCENRTSNNSKSNEKKLEAARDYLASGGRDRSVRLWQISSQSCLHVFQVHENWVRSVLIHPSGNYIISGGDDRSIRVLDIQSQRCLRTLESAHPHFVTSLSMHPTLPILVSGSVDTTCRCWVLD